MGTHSRWDRNITFLPPTVVVLEYVEMLIEHTYYRVYMHVRLYQIPEYQGDPCINTRVERTAQARGCSARFHGFSGCVRFMLNRARQPDDNECDQA